jgi:hypothetical protein
MADYITLSLPSGATVSIGNHAEQEIGTRHVGQRRSDEICGQFDDYIAPIGEVAEVLLKKFIGTVTSPNEVNLEFGVGFKGKSGIILISGEINADIKVKLIWKKQ